jgi:hypothetical protein
VTAKPLSEVELNLVFAVLDFANTELEFPRQVEAIFRRLPLNRRAWRTMEGQPGALDAFRRDQKEVVGWLDSIARRGGVGKADEQLIAKRLRETVKVKCVIDLQGGQIVERRAYFIEGVQASYSLGVALLLGVADRLGRCEFSRCNNFFFHTGRRPDRARYCSTKHAAADRQRRFRQPTSKWS